jgi:flagellar motor switch protein FliM
MTQELLNSEERSALKSLYTTPDVVVAVFPSVSQLDKEQQSAFFNVLTRWGIHFQRELTTILRLPCVFLPPQQLIVSQNQRWRGDEEIFHAVYGPEKGQSLSLALPRPFAAALCERLFGAPMSLQADRKLMPSERSLLRELVAEWLIQLSIAFQLTTLRLNDGNGADDEEEEESSSLWMRVECPLRCGTVESALYISLSVDGVRDLLGITYQQTENEVAHEEVNTRLGDVPLEIHAVLGQAEFSLDALANLQLGDVITLDRHSEDLVDLTLDNNVLLRARAALAGQNVVLEVVSGPKQKGNG